MLCLDLLWGLDSAASGGGPHWHLSGIAEQANLNSGVSLYELKIFQMQEKLVHRLQPQISSKCNKE